MFEVFCTELWQVERHRGFDVASENGQTIQETDYPCLVKQCSIDFMNFLDSIYNADNTIYTTLYHNDLHRVHYETTFMNLARRDI